MAYIKFDITGDSVDNGKRLSASISRLRSNIVDTNIYELNIILHALARMDTVREILSCYGAGYWRGNKPWHGSDAWKS